MSGKKEKKARKILREELRAKLSEEKVEIMPQVRTLKQAVLNLKPCFEIFGLTIFATKDVLAFYNTLKDWIGERPARVARKKFWQIFKKVSEKPEVIPADLENVSRETEEKPA